MIGLIDLPWWGYGLALLGLTHITISSVTIFLHRHQAHRSLDLHPGASHFFRFWLWFTTGIVTKEWVAIHRKHHAKCETEEDPHSPVILGIKKVLTQGYELYRKEAANKETLTKYGHNTPDDWLERKVYSRHSKLGIFLLLGLNLVLWGPIGLTLWAIQMLWIPVNAAGIINGMGHFWGYRNYECADASTNIVPWGILIGGEELHNNHHAYASSAKLSSQWYEIDIGWLYIRILSLVRLAKVKKIAPQVRLDWSKTVCDLSTLQAVMTHRYEVMTNYAISLKKTYSDECLKIKGKALNPGEVSRIRPWLQMDSNALTEYQREKVSVLIDASPIVRTAYMFRQELSLIWQRSPVSKEHLVHQLEDWCFRAEHSGIVALREFSRRLRCYV